MKQQNPITIFCYVVFGAFVAWLAAYPVPLIQAQHIHGQPEQATVSPKAAETPVTQNAQPLETPQIEVSPEQQTLIGVKIVEAAMKPMQALIRTVGKVEVDETKLATVNTKVEGWIEKLHIDYTGRFLVKGEPLAEIYSPELLATQQEFINLLNWSKQSDTTIMDDSLRQMFARDNKNLLDAARERLTLWDITEEQIRKIEESGKPRRTLTLFSPFSGYIVQKTVFQGMRVMPGEKLFDVADLSTLWVISDIYDYELSLVKIGQQAKITLSYLPGREYTSRLDYVYPSLSAETRTIKVRFAVANTDGQLKPQMYTNVEIRINLSNRLAIPESALLDTGKGEVVYVSLGEGIFEPREVRSGIRAGGMVEILKGLKEGEKVASAANFLLDSESQLRGVKPLPSR